MSAEEEDFLEDEEVEEAEVSGPAIRVRIIIDKRQEPMRIDKFIVNRIEGITRNKVQEALDEGMITVNGQPVKSNYKIRPGDDIVVLDTRRPEYLEVLPEEMPLNIVYEDEALMIINKPAGLVVHPGSGNANGTLINGLAFYLQKDLPDISALHRVGLVHRIDKNTSGLILIAKTEGAMSHLAAQFKKHTVHRRYVALAWGDFEEETGTVEAHIGRHQRHRMMFAAYPDGDYGKEAITHYKVLERFGYVTLMELQLETGRTHQIRVHMQHIGHPLFGDTTYGGDRIAKGTVFAKYKAFVENCFTILPRQALHAKELGFVHPLSSEKMLFTSELPADMAEVIEKWRRYTAGIKLN